MKINNKKIKVFRKIKNFILIGTLTTAIITSPSFATTAKAIEPDINNYGNYYLSDDQYSLDIDGTIDYSVISSMNKIVEVFITNATIDSTFKFNSTGIKQITFKNCNFTNPNFENNKNTTKYSFVGCKFDNLNFLSKCNNITKLNFDSCEIGNVDALNNLSNLEIINFYDVGIENINFLKNKKKLSQLILSNTCVTDLSPIAYSNIGYLDISNTLSIRDLSPILTLNKLYSFSAENCEMSYSKEIYNFIKRNRIDSNIDRNDLKIKDEVEAIAKKIINNNMTAEDKIFAIVNYVVDNIEYDYNAAQNPSLASKYNQKALRYALDGVGCCRNYSALTTALMQASGIKVYEIRSFNHIWNLIELEGDYYWIDSTLLDGLDDIEILEDENYMNDNLTFPGHPQLTLPVSMYKSVYSDKKENDKSNVIIETTTSNNINNQKNETTIFNDITDDIKETITSSNSIVNNTETTTSNNTSTNIDTAETTTKNNDINTNETTTSNNNYIDADFPIKSEVTTQVVINEQITQKLSNNLKAKKAAIGVTAGIAAALGFAKVIKIKKKQQTKIK